MSEHLAKSYLLEALYRWCIAVKLTPYLAIGYEPTPCDEEGWEESYKDDPGEMFFDLSAKHARDVFFVEKGVKFTCDLYGEERIIFYPHEEIMAIFAKETGYGIFFKGGSSVPCPIEEGRKKYLLPLGRTEKVKRAAMLLSRAHLKLVT